MNDYSDLHMDVPWGAVVPLNLGGPIVIDPHSTFVYQFNTTGSYLGGHVYFKYDIAFDSGSGLGDMFSDFVLGDHPVTPAPGALALFAMAGVMAWSRRRR
jgi:MYXO-CTERM domain-containing protein